MLKIAFVLMQANAYISSSDKINVKFDFKPKTRYGLSIDVPEATQDLHFKSLFKKEVSNHFVQDS